MIKKRMMSTFIERAQQIASLLNREEMLYLAEKLVFNYFDQMQNKELVLFLIHALFSQEIVERLETENTLNGGESSNLLRRAP